MTPAQILTLALAVYGAIVSTILGVREIRNGRRRILVILEYVAFYERAQVKITNTGYRPINITEIGVQIYFEQEGKGFWDQVPRNSLFGPAVEAEPFPTTIDDGEHLTLPLSDVVGSQLLENGMRAKVTVYDVEGNEYREFKTRLHNPKWGSYAKMGP